MELFNDGNGWQSMHDDLLFTAAMLRASEAHVDLAKPIDGLLVKWDALDAEGTKVDREVVKANARVAWVNLELDARTTRCASQLLTDCNNERGHPTFKRFFPTAPGELIRLGLESQLKAMERFPTLADELPLSKASAAAMKAVVEVFDAGREALAARAEVVQGTTRMSVKQAAWRDEANKLRRATETALDEHANKHGLPRDYAAGFFPSQKKPAKKTAPTEAERVLALPDAVLRLLPGTYIATLPADAQATIRTRLAG